MKSSWLLAAGIALGAYWLLKSKANTTGVSVLPLAFAGPPDQAAVFAGLLPTVDANGNIVNPLGTVDTTQVTSMIQ